MNELIKEQIKLDKQNTWQTSLQDLSDDFIHGLMTFHQFERAKKLLYKDIFGVD